MARIRTLLIGGVVGATAAYLFDPDLGGARRARLMDRFGATVREGRRSLDQYARQLQDRGQGLTTQVGGWTAVEDEDDDLTVLSRVESVLFGMPDFPKGAIDAEVVNGRLVLRGQVASEEVARRIVEAAARIRGVADVESLLHLPGEEAPNKAAARRVR